MLKFNVLQNSTLSISYFSKVILLNFIKTSLSNSNYAALIQYIMYIILDFVFVPSFFVSIIKMKFGWTN